MHLWIDADACPTAVREIVLRAAEKRRIDTTFVANKYIPVPALRWINAVQVSQGMDVADHYIAERVKPEDLVVTQDVPLAADVVAAGAMAISPRGMVWTAENVREKLSLRDFFTEARASGVKTGGPPPFDHKAKQTFANALDRWVTMGLRKRG